MYVTTILYQNVDTGCGGILKPEVTDAYII